MRQRASGEYIFCTYDSALKTRQSQNFATKRSMPAARQTPLDRPTARWAPQHTLPHDRDFNISNRPRVLQFIKLLATCGTSFEMSMASSIIENAPTSSAGAIVLGKSVNKLCFSIGAFDGRDSRRGGFGGSLLSLPVKNYLPNLSMLSSFLDRLVLNPWCFSRIFC